MKKKVEKYTEKQDMWQERYDIAVSNQETMFARFAKWYDLMYATVNDENIALWRSKVFIPILASKVWNLVAKFVNLKPGFEVTVRDPEQAPEDLKALADKISKKLEYDYDNPNLDEPIRDKLLQPLIDAIVTGTGIAKVPWHTKTVERKKRIIGADGTVDLTKEEVTKMTYGCNDIVPVNIFNVFVAPASRNLYSAPWIMIKEYKTHAELEKMNDESGSEMYKNLDKLADARADSDQFAQYKKSRNRLTNDQDPIVSDKTLDMIPIYECYERDSNKIYTYADAGTKDAQAMPWVEIRQQTNPYWHGKYPLVRFVLKQRPYDFWGEGLFEVTERLQYAVNDVFNHYMDNWNLSVDGLFFIEENSNVDDFIVQPGGQIRYSQTKPESSRIPEPNPNSVNTVTQMIEKSIEDATISSYATGNPNSATDTTQGTATGIMRLQQAAGDIISFLKSNFQQSINTIGDMWLSNNQQYLDRDVTLMENGEASLVSPGDFGYEMELRIDDASMEPVSKEDQRQVYLQYIQQTMQLQQASAAQAQVAGTDPLVLDFQELFRQTSDQYGIKTVDKIIITPEQLQEEQEEKQQEMMQEQQMNPEMQGEMQPEMQPEMPQDDIVNQVNQLTPEEQELALQELTSEVEEEITNGQ